MGIVEKIKNHLETSPEYERENRMMDTESNRDQLETDNAPRNRMMDTISNAQLSEGLSGPIDESKDEFQGKYSLTHTMSNKQTEERLLGSSGKSELVNNMIDTRANKLGDIENLYSQTGEDETTLNNDRIQ